jgi:hypothetical protein
MTLVPTLKLSLEMTNVLTRIEMNGLKINLKTLYEIEKQYNEELSYLETKLQTMAKEAMGDTPVNLSSPDDRSVLLYSRRVKEKSLWSVTFNLGHEMRGNTMKPKLRTRMKANDFIRNVRNMTDVVYKTVGQMCAGCLGHGRVRMVNKNGQPSKVLRVCKPCSGKELSTGLPMRLQGLRLYLVTQEILHQQVSRLTRSHLRIGHLNLVGMPVSFVLPTLDTMPFVLTYLPL